MTFEWDDGGGGGGGGSLYPTFGPNQYGQYRIGPGSGNHWADGMQYSDWSAHGGSQMFRDAKANGARLIGGTQYMADGDGNYRALSSQGGQLGYWQIDARKVMDPHSSDGYAVATEEKFIVQAGNANGGPGVSESESGFPYNSVGLALNIAGSGFSVLKSEYRPLLKEFTKTAIKAKALTGKMLGAAGFALTAYQFGSKLADPNRQLNVNDYLGFGVGLGTFAAGLMVVNPVGLAVVIGVGVGYGIYTLWRDDGK